MEQFVRLLVAGGIVLVVGLWLASGFTVWSPPWLLGVVLAVVGSGGLAAGIRSEIEWP